MPPLKMLTTVEYTRRCYQAQLASEHNATSVRLFSIPPEIRNAIYEHALPRDRRYWAGTQRGSLSNVEGFDGVVEVDVVWDDRFEIPGLLRTSKQTRKEATGIFFSVNSITSYSFIKTDTFQAVTSLSTPKALTTFPLSILRNITNLRIVILFGIYDYQDRAHRAYGTQFHTGEIHFVKEGKEYKLQGEWDGCEENDTKVEWACCGRMKQFLGYYRRVTKTLLVDRIKHTAGEMGDDESANEFVWMRRAALTSPDTGDYGQWVVTYEATV